MRRLLIALLTAAFVAAGATAAVADPAAGRTEYTLKSLYVDGRGDSRTTVVGNGGTVRLTPSLSWRYWSDTLSAPHIGLQRKREGGAWQDVAAGSVTVPHDLEHEQIAVWTRPWSTKRAKETVAYRLVSHAYSDAHGLVTSTSHSRAFTVRYENQERYTGLRAVAWSAVQQYCPTTAVVVGGTDEEDAAGEFFTGASRIHVASVIATYTPAQQRGVALHECAHELQWLHYGSTEAGEDRMARAAARIYTDDAAPDGSSDPSEQPFDAVEHAADCASHAVEPEGYLGYGGWCDADELAAGLRLMRGGRY